MGGLRWRLSGSSEPHCDAAGRSDRDPTNVPRRHDRTWMAVALPRLAMYWLPPWFVLIHISTVRAESPVGSPAGPAQVTSHRWLLPPQADDLYRRGRVRGQHQGCVGVRREGRRRLHAPHLQSRDAQARTLEFARRSFVLRLTHAWRNECQRRSRIDPMARRHGSAFTRRGHRVAGGRECQASRAPWEPGAAWATATATAHGGDSGRPNSTRTGILCSRLPGEWPCD